MGGKVDRKKLVAFDFAGTGIKAIAAEVMDNNAIKIISEEARKVEGIKYGIIGQPSGTAFNVVALLKELHNSSGMQEQIKKFSVAFGGKSMKIVEASVQKKLNKTKPITEEMINAMADECEKSYQVEEMEVYDTIPVMYEVDGVTMEKPEGQKGSIIVGTYHLVVGSALMKTQLYKCMERIYNCRIEHMPLAAEAFSIAISEDDERKAGCALINMGDSSTTLAIYKDEILQYLLVVPLGGRNITKDIEEIGITEEYAEKLKCKKGTSMQQFVDVPVNIRIPAKNPQDEPVTVTNLFISMIIESRLDEIFNPIFQALKEREKELPSGIIITGGAAKLDKMKEYLEAKTGITTRYGDHSGWLTEDTPEKYFNMEYAQLVGTIILTNEYREENQKLIEIEETKPAKKPKNKSSFGDKLGQRIFNFFGEDTDLVENNQTNTQA
jgi:cell division protein FtsA